MLPRAAASPDALAHSIRVVEASSLAPDDKRNLVDQLQLTHKHAIDLTLTELRRARRYAGISIEQAAVLLSVSPAYLEDVEHGAKTPSAELLAEMDRVYGLRKEAA